MRTYARDEFVWRGQALHLGRRKTPLLRIVPDKPWPHLYRIQYPNGWLSTPANISRAKDAAFGHALHLLNAGGEAHRGGQEMLSEAA